MVYALVALVAWFETAAVEETVYTEGFFYYTIQDQSITIVGYFGKETTVTVPSAIAGIPVNGIASEAFAGTNVQILYLPETIMNLGENATGNAEVRFTGQPTITLPPATEQPALPTPEVIPTEKSSPTPDTTENETGSPVSENPTETPGTTPAVATDTVSPVNDTPDVHESPTSPQGTIAPTETDAPQTFTVTEPTEEPSDEPLREKNSIWIWFSLGAIVAAAGVIGILVALRFGKKD